MLLCLATSTKISCQRALKDLVMAQTLIDMKTVIACFSIQTSKMLDKLKSNNDLLSVERTHKTSSLQIRI